MAQVFITCESNSIWIDNNDRIKCDWGFQTIPYELVVPPENTFKTMNYESADALLVATIALLGLAYLFKIAIKTLKENDNEKN